MARGPRAKDDDAPRKDADQFCAEHSGEIASFDKLGVRLSDLAEYGELFRRDTTNYAKVARVATGVVTGTVVAAPVFLFAAPAFAASLGVAGMLGTTASGTTISTLSGAALAKASLAAIGGGALSVGGGGMALGSVIVVAAGSALGGVQGAVVSNAYFRDVQDYSVQRLSGASEDSLFFVKRVLRRLRRLLRPRFADCDNLVFINGFLQQYDDCFEDWLHGVGRCFPRSRKYGVVWESKSLKKVGRDLLTAEGMAKLGKQMSRYVLSLQKKPGALVSLVPALVANPWHTTMVRSSMVGAINADLLCRVEGQTTTLMGHSLGARTIYYTLQNLSQRPDPNKLVRDVFLFGGAIGRNNKEDWARAAAQVGGHIYNFYSINDSVLKFLYRSASGLFSEPIGLGPIDCGAPNVVNLDCSDLVGGHHEYKPNLESLLARALVAKAST